MFTTNDTNNLMTDLEARDAAELLADHLLCDSSWQSVEVIITDERHGLAAIVYEGMRGGWREELSLTSDLSDGVGVWLMDDGGRPSDVLPAYWDEGDAERIGYDDLEAFEYEHPARVALYAARGSLFGFVAWTAEATAAHLERWPAYPFTSTDWDRLLEDDVAKVRQYMRGTAYGWEVVDLVTGEGLEGCGDYLEDDDACDDAYRSLEGIADERDDAAGEARGDE